MWRQSRAGLDDQRLIQVIEPRAGGRGKSPRSRGPTYMPRAGANPRSRRSTSAYRSALSKCMTALAAAALRRPVDRCGGSALPRSAAYRQHVRGVQRRAPAGSHGPDGARQRASGHDLPARGTWRGPGHHERDRLPCPGRAARREETTARRACSPRWANGTLMARKINNRPAEGTGHARDTGADLQRSSWSG